MKDQLRALAVFILAGGGGVGISGAGVVSSTTREFLPLFRLDNFSAAVQSVA